MSLEIISSILGKILVTSIQFSFIQNLSMKPDIRIYDEVIQHFFKGCLIERDEIILIS